jgi:hypothetical protein
MSFFDIFKGPQSKANTKVLTDQINDLILTSMQSCGTNVDLEQSLNVSGQGNVVSNLYMEQIFTSILTCVNKTDWMSKLQNDISTNIKQSSETKSVALLGILGASNSDVNLNIDNSVKNAINLKTMTSMINNIRQKQSVNVSGVGNVVRYASLKQVQSNISSSVQEIVASIDVLNKITNTGDQKSKATQDDPIKDFFDGVANVLTGPLKWITIMIVGALALLVIFINSGGGTDFMNLIIGNEDDTDEYVTSEDVTSEDVTDKSS